MIKAIFFDIDGTLLSFRTHQVSAGTIEAFDNLRRKGIYTFIASGRPPKLIAPMPVQFDGAITMNGGYCYVDNKVVLDNPLNPEDSLRWLHYAEKHNIVTMLFGSHEICVNRIDAVAEQLRNQLEFAMPPILSIEEMSQRKAYQFIAMIPQQKDAEVLELLPHCRLPRWHPAFSDLIPENSSKAEGIERVIQHLGIRREETLAIGDGANDIEMLEYAGIGVAMGNASDEVKQHADHITTDVDHEGIQQALKALKVI